MTEPQPSPQELTLRAFTAIHNLRAEWAGHLILSLGLNPEGAALALAANIAGAASLAIDPSSETCRAALRSGAVDFAVNTLDEALRALKNEIRKGRPLSVALEGDTASVLSELLERGVLPTLFAACYSVGEDLDIAAITAATEKWHALGTIILASPGLQQSSPYLVHADGQVRAFTTHQGLTLETFHFESAAELRSFDTRVLHTIPPADPRHRWAAAAARHFHRPVLTEPRAFLRVLFLTLQEREFLTAAPEKPQEIGMSSPPTP